MVSVRSRNKSEATRSGSPRRQLWDGREKFAGVGIVWLAHDMFGKPRLYELTGAHGVVIGSL